MTHVFPVAYTWADREDPQREFQGTTAVSGPDTATALAGFLRRNPTLTDAWIVGSRTGKRPNAECGVRSAEVGR